MDARFKSGRAIGLTGQQNQLKLPGRGQRIVQRRLAERERTTRGDNECEPDSMRKATKCPPVKPMAFWRSPHARIAIQVCNTLSMASAREFT